MRAAVFDRDLRYVEDYPAPVKKPGWAVIKVALAGICKTDMEILKGYRGFRGVLGHEFVGTVTASDDARWIGRRVAGEITAACGKCGFCAEELGRHCPDSSTLGIFNLDGCMADRCTLPLENLLPLPDDISDERAVLIEPLSATCEILEQVPVSGNERIIVLGDGRLGILCAWVLATASADVTLIGHHPEKLEIVGWRGIRCIAAGEKIRGGART